MRIEKAAEEFPLNGIKIFGGGDSRFLSYRALFDKSTGESKAIQGLLNLDDAGNQVVVLHTDNHLEGISVSSLRKAIVFLASKHRKPLSASKIQVPVSTIEDTDDL